MKLCICQWLWASRGASGRWVTGYIWVISEADLRPEVGVNGGGFCGEEGPNDFYFAGAEGEDVVAGDDEGSAGHFAQRFSRAAINDGGDAGPVDRAGAHCAGFGAGIKGSLGQDRRVELVGGEADQIQFRMVGDISIGVDAVFGREQNTTAGNQQRTKWMIALTARLGCQFN